MRDEDVLYQSWPHIYHSEISVTIYPGEKSYNSKQVGKPLNEDQW